MSRIPVTPDETLALVQELNAVLPKFALEDPKEAARIARTFREVFLPIDGEAVRGGMRLGLKLWERFPSPAAWREQARLWIKHNRPLPADDGATARDIEGRGIICKTCRSVARSAWLRRPDGSEYSRLIAPCNLDRHGTNERVTFMPDNFLAWDDRTDEQHYADDRQLTASRTPLLPSAT